MAGLDFYLGALNSRRHYFPLLIDSKPPGNPGPPGGGIFGRLLEIHPFPKDMSKEANHLIGVLIPFLVGSWLREWCRV